MGLRTGETFELLLPEEIPSLTFSEEEALEFAKQTRSAYIAFERKEVRSGRSSCTSAGFVVPGGGDSSLWSQ